MSDGGRYWVNSQGRRRPGWFPKLDIYIYVKSHYSGYSSSYTSYRSYSADGVHMSNSSGYWSTSK